MINFKNLKNNRAIQIAAIIAVPTVLVAGYFGYKYIKKKMDEKNESKFILEMREKYKNINSIDDFLEGIKYVTQPVQYGYDFKLIGKKKDKLTSFSFDELKDIYELLKKTLTERSEEENQKVMTFLQKIYA